ncbi:MAG TPA: hypothetical protein VFJ84_02365 [Candidatus Saccharimonadales bacterium]|nr:hypothetical protein [Candidatus Saccharimonadales bacterium]
MELPYNLDAARYAGRPHPMAQLDASEAALAARLGVDQAPYHPPAEKFYHSNYIMDGCVAADLRTAYGYYRKSATQLLSFCDYQRADGFITGVKHPPKRFTINPERLLSTSPFEGNDYTQTPIIAYSVLKLHDRASSRPPVSPAQAIDPDKFLAQIYPVVQGYYDHLMEHRQVAEDDPRVFLLHPHEANRDSGPEYDEWKTEELQRQFGKLAASLLRRKPRRGEHMGSLFNKRNRAIDYAGALAINLAGYKAGWKPERVHENTEFIDVWFNYLLRENYLAMSELSSRVGREEDADRYRQTAGRLGEAMLRHYLPEARGGKGAFYSIYNGKPQLRDTIGNLTPLLDGSLPASQLHSLVTLINEGFSPDYPLPSVATDNRDVYDPHYEEYDRHWRGPKWPVADVIVMRGISRQLSRDGVLLPAIRQELTGQLQGIHESNLAVVDITGDYAEHHNPVTGIGQRMHRTRGHVFGAAAHTPIEYIREDALPRAA